MTNMEKLRLLEEMLYIEKDSLKEEMVLNEMPEWDSMAAISLIALLDSTFGKKITADEIRKFIKVKDILDVMV